LFNPRLAAEL